MATFEIQQGQFQRWVKITLHNEAVRAEAGALSYMRGDIVVDTPLPSLGSIDQVRHCRRAVDPPALRRHGRSLSRIELRRLPCLRDRGSALDPRERRLLGLRRHGEARSSPRTHAHLAVGWRRPHRLSRPRSAAQGRVVLNAAGPVEEIDLGHETISVEGKLVIARTADVSYRVVGRPGRCSASGCRARSISASTEVRARSCWCPHPICAGPTRSMQRKRSASSRRPPRRTSPCPRVP